MTEASLLLDGQPLRFFIRRNPKAKRIWIKVEEPHGLVVVLPRWGRLRDAHEVLQKNRRWVEGSLARRESRKAEAPPPLGEGGCLPYRGRSLALQTAAVTTGRATLDLRDRRFVLRHATGEPPRAFLELWYRERARREFARRLDRFSAAMGVSPKGVTVRDPKTRWGSCSSRGTLSFSWRLLFAPIAVLDYVVIHELAHLAHPDHSPRFWAKVRAHCPGADASRAWLRKNHGLLQI